MSTKRKINAALVLLAACLASTSLVAAEPPETRIYLVDVGHGNCLVAVAPSGQTLMLDTGTGNMANRVLAFLEQNGIRKLDYLLLSHFENDHMGGAAAFVEKIPVGKIVDHGDCVTYHKSDEWWKQRRGPWFREGMGKQFDEFFDKFLAARAKVGHLAVKPGDLVPILLRRLRHYWPSGES